MYVCMHVCTKSFLKTTTNSSCVCTHLANKADSDSDSENYYNKIKLYCVKLMWKLHSELKKKKYLASNLSFLTRKTAIKRRLMDVFETLIQGHSTGGPRAASARLH